MTPWAVWRTCTKARGLFHPFPWQSSPWAIIWNHQGGSVNSCPGHQCSHLPCTDESGACPAVTRKYTDQSFMNYRERGQWGGVQGVVGGCSTVTLGNRGGESMVVANLLHSFSQSSSCHHAITLASAGDVGEEDQRRVCSTFFSHALPLFI